MLAFIINVLIIALVMKLFFKFMYPKPPQAFFPKEGDDTTVRQCHQCQHHLATYRGILIHVGDQEYFFCNQEHQDQFAVNNPDFQSINDDKNAMLGDIMTANKSPDERI